MTTGGGLSRRTVLKGAVGAGALAGAVGGIAPRRARAQESYQVAYLTPGLNVPFWKYLSDGIKQAAERDAAATGAQITVTDYDSRNDAATQLQNAQDVITAGVSLIIISPTDSSTAPEVLQTAADAGVPVVIADIGTDSGDYVSFVISSNEQGAYEAGLELNKALVAAGFSGPQQILTIQISQARRNGQNRTRGFDRAMAEGGHEVVQALESEDYTRAEAQGQALDMLTANEGARGFFTQHDEASLGALAAIDDAGRRADTVHVGFDGSPESVVAIREGLLKAAAMQQPVLMGRNSMEVGLRHLRGETVEKETEVPTILVTTENVDALEAQLADTVFPVEGGAATPSASPAATPA